MRIRHCEVRLGDVKRNYANTSKAEGVLGWKPVVGLEKGIDRTVDYFVETFKAHDRTKSGLMNKV
jgi:UDP-glucose 4-epimerase